MRLAWLAAAIALGAAPAASAAGLQTDVVFTQTTPLASNAELVRRLISPLGGLAVTDALARGGKALPDLPLDLAAERFALFVPAQAPPKGYGLVVFVPPWNQAELPRGWSEALDREGLIFVTAARSGNDQPIFDRRAPLALAAAANAMARYPVNPARVYVAGFSGGSRVALRLALGYPDIFRGAVLIAGADALGAPPVPPPPRDLFERFRSGTRLVYLTGEDDAANLPDDVASEASMRAFCVAGVTSIEVAHMAHQIAAEADFDRALRLLDAAPTADTARLAACRAKLDAELAAKLADAATLVGKGDKAARARLADIDRRFGGLAAPRIEELWRQATSP